MMINKLFILAWLWVGVLYCIYFNTTYLWNMEGVFSFYAVLKFIFPLIMIMTGVDMSTAQVRFYYLTRGCALPLGDLYSKAEKKPKTIPRRIYKNKLAQNHLSNYNKIHCKKEQYLLSG